MLTSVMRMMETMGTLSNSMEVEVETEPLNKARFCIACSR